MFVDKRVLTIAAAILAVGLAALVHAWSAAWALNADAIYPLTFARDRLAHGMSEGWLVPPADCFLPDVTASALGLVLGANGYANIAFVYVVFCVALGVAAGTFLWGHGVRELQAVAGATTVVALFVLFKTDDGLTRLYLSPAHHQTAMIFALSGFGLFMHGSRRANLGLLLVSMLGVASDPVLVTQLALPVVSVCLLSRQRFVGGAAVLIGAAVGGLALRPLFGLLVNVHHGTVGSHVTLEGILRSAVLLASGLRTILADASAWRGYSGIAAWVVLLCFCRRSPLALSGVLLTFWGFVGPVLSGTWSHPAYFRQQLPLFLVPQLTLVGVAFQRFGHSEGRAALAGGLGLALSVVSSALTMPSQSPFLARHAELLQGIAAHHVSAVLAEYWEAKPLVLLSDFGLPVCPISHELSPYAWSTNLAWCSHLVDRPDGLIAVVGGELNEVHVLEVLGSPLHRDAIAGFSVWYYPKARVMALGRLDRRPLTPPD